ncbi:1,4-alpha-glucan-branching enzyme, putative [Entamoeba dispar SAW760]|uniref:1,4-alpha-glucan branching enzyme n=2 Tax=Entamoeba dispar (strain ATCC PRA-260 / SAW760) TaxID=370354 RepID=B0EFB9_ENTDS|nr:1,4-alpha-glucan-branching enzyme, putative [Entamoeba dispar SAW760]EDR26767.1 1,4-alpha-glucan-branching enzyme, putative [Entamoeba dispar SAW760]|eukprot:EDR26767.1 1,4-alpha-glucan-branching enzyme, putative [Entamoeba dispar SAW760]
MSTKLQMIVDDPYLEPFAATIYGRQKKTLDVLSKIEHNEGSLEEFANSYKRYGLNRTTQKENGKEVEGWSIREWAPNFKEMYLFGDFNKWDRATAIKLVRDEFGTHSGFIPDENGESRIKHLSKIKVFGITYSGERLDRIPTYHRYCVLNPKTSSMEAVVYNPEHPYIPTSPKPKIPKALKIYESHVGICTPEKKIASYDEFRERIVPYCKKVGYNTIQLMAIMEHPYYASFGYQVTNFFAASSRFGTPDALKHLIDECHKEGIIVLLDIVHSHTSANVVDGINMFDGSDGHYLLAGEQGKHPLWGSRLFNYNNYETLRFLLSNVKYYAEEFGFDGFRFDGVTSMIYTHHGVGAHTFDYAHYFSPNANEDALTYLSLVNILVHRKNMNCVTVAEDVSGYAGLCRTFEDGGIGFDYRLAMSCPDLWVEYLKTKKDEEWNVNHIGFVLNNRRWKEKAIAYAECHDQALVGDKTISFWLMDKEMYTGMSCLWQPSLIIDRGIALHKMIRLVTCMLGGEGYLTFMGNEFGHPEWLDFPREGNGDSFHYCRRQYNLVEDHLLRYKFLLAFEREMLHLEDQYPWLNKPNAYISKHNEGDHVLAFQRGAVIGIFNFHYEKSFTGYGIGVKEPGTYKIILNSDSSEFGGYDRITSQEYISQPIECDGLPNQIQIYIPCRVAIVLTKIN